MKTFFLLVLTLVLGPVAIPQKALNINAKNACSYYSESFQDKVYGFEPGEDAQEIIARITDAVGLKSNFEIRAANIPNAMAYVEGGKRFILYSENFISHIKNATGTDWAAISVLAHEIGHHLNGHTLNEEGSRPELELEADKFSGFALAQMGASLDNAQAAINKAGNNSGSATHPPKSARLEAIAVGWKKAQKAQVPSVPSSGNESRLKNENSSKPSASPPQQPVSCYNCNGKGVIARKTACSQCSGSGMQICSSCNGKQPSLAGWVCQRCRGKGKSACPGCNGAGLVEVKAVCEKCNGQGKI